MKTGGNLAYKEAVRDVPVNYSRQNVKKKRKMSRASYAVAVFYIVIIFAIAFFVVMREVSIAQENNNVNSMTKQLEDARADNKRTMLELESSIDLKNVEKLVAEKYGMARPEKHQIVYINVKQHDFTEKVAQRDVVAELSETVGSGFNNLFGIFSVQ